MRKLVSRSLASQVRAAGLAGHWHSGSGCALPCKAIKLG
jgi:hypothetical protein